jgi:hypothetical protein
MWSTTTVTITGVSGLKQVTCWSIDLKHRWSQQSQRKQDWPKAINSKKASIAWVPESAGALRVLEIMRPVHYIVTAGESRASQKTKDVR